MYLSVMSSVDIVNGQLQWGAGVITGYRILHI